MGFEAGACHAKRVKANIQGYPIANGNATFYQMDRAAIPVTTKEGVTLGYIAHSIMNPLLELGQVKPKTSPTDLPDLKQGEKDFLMGEVM